MNAMKTALVQSEILLVEDNIGDAELTIAAFGETGAGHNFYTINNGEDAIAYLHEKAMPKATKRPDLILLDLNLPRKNGWEVLQDIKTDPVLKTIPVVMLTNSQDEKDIATCYGLHANSYIVKPLGFEEFSQAVRSMEHFWLRTAARP